MSLEASIQDSVLDHILGAGNYDDGSGNVYVALYTVAPTEDGGGTEVSGGSYARVTKDDDAAAWPAASGGEKTNGEVITFPTSTGVWGEVVAWGIHRHATNDDLIAFGAIEGPPTIGSGEDWSFPVGNIVIRIE